MHTPTPPISETGVSRGPLLGGGVWLCLVPSFIPRFALFLFPLHSSSCVSVHSSKHGPVFGHRWPKCPPTPRLSLRPLPPHTLTLFSRTSYSCWLPFPILLRLCVLSRRPLCLSVISLNITHTCHCSTLRQQGQLWSKPKLTKNRRKQEKKHFSNYQKEKKLLWKSGLPLVYCYLITVAGLKLLKMNQWSGVGQTDPSLGSIKYIYIWNYIEF